jgi:hypothetical protein
VEAERRQMMSVNASGLRSRRAVVFLFGVAVGVGGVCAWLGMERAWRARQVLGAASSWDTHLTWKYIGSAGSLDVVEVMGDLVGESPEKKVVWIYSQRTPLLSMELNKEGTPTIFTAHLDDVKVYHRRMTASDRGYLVVVLRTLSSTIEHSDYDGDGIFDERRVDVARSQAQHATGKAEIWWSGHWVQTDGSRANQHVIKIDGKPLLVVFQDHCWVPTSQPVQPPDAATEPAR